MHNSFFLVAGKQTSEDSKKTLIWAIPVGIVFAVLLGALAYFVVKSRRLKRSFYHLVRSDSFDHGVTYHNVGKKTTVVKFCFKQLSYMVVIGCLKF
jgi:uncharacterized protein YpmB